ncbi:histone-lysine N-methyltransferase [Klebsiella aerogenes]|nr:histone-lysine N-methyltransferase [Klebsiella aerogenes]
MYELTLSPVEIAHGIPFTTDRRNRPIVLRRSLAPNITELPKVDEYVAKEPNFDAIYGKTT